jgi:hypothetical protein
MMLFLCPSFQREIEDENIREDIEGGLRQTPSTPGSRQWGNPYFLYIYIDILSTLTKTFCPFFLFSLFVSTLLMCTFF